MSVWDLQPKELRVVPAYHEDEPLDRLVKVYGMDLGQTNDPCAVAELNVHRYDSAFIGPRDDKARCKSLFKWPTGTDYTKVADDVMERDWDVLCVEFNGVGRPFVDLLRREKRNRNKKGQILPVVSGSPNIRLKAYREERGSFVTIPKIELATCINVLREQRLMAFDVDEESKQLLLEDMRRFKTRKTTKGETFEFQPGEGATGHGDLVIAFGLCCWFVHRFANREASLFI